MLWRIALCMILSVFIVVSPVCAKEQGVDNEWRIPFLGVMSGEGKFQAIDMLEWLKTLDELLKKENIQGTNPKSLTDKEVVLPKEIKIYQLQVDDGKAWHIAAAVAVKDEKGEVPGFSDYFSPVLGPEQADKLADWNEKMKAGIKLVQTQLDTTQIAGLKIMDLKPLERLRSANEVIYHMGGRVLLQMNGAVFPVYTKIYMAEREGKAVILMLITSDADGRFWEKTCDRLMQSLHK